MVAKGTAVIATMIAVVKTDEVEAVPRKSGEIARQFRELIEIKQPGCHGIAKSMQPGQVATVHDVPAVKAGTPGGTEGIRAHAACVQS